MLMRNCLYHNENAKVLRKLTPGKDWQLPFMLKENWVRNAKGDDSLFKASLS